MNVSKIREFGLCTSCEICSASCPFDAISMRYEDGQFVPKVDSSKCTDCGLCYKACPGMDIKTDGLDAGPHLEAYSAYTKNREILQNSTSGGCISQLVIDLLNKGRFRGAFVLDFDTFKRKPARLTLATNESEVKKASRSKYIPASVYNVIKELERSEKPNFIIVGTPCQLSGIKRFIELKGIDDSGLLFLGLFCEKTLNYNVLRYFEERYSKKDEKLVRFDFKNKEKDGWPGHPKLYFDSGRTLMVSRDERIKVKDYYQLERCIYCTDKLNRMADISFGDCYIAGKDNPGRSSIVIRTEKGQNIWEECSDSFVHEPSSFESIKRSQHWSDKKENLDLARLLVTKCDLFQGSAQPPTPGAKQSYKRHKKMISIGKKGDIKKLTRAISLSSKKNYFKYICEGLKLGWGLFLFYVKDTFYKKKPEKIDGNIVIFGGELSNKGAQAMTYTVVDKFKRIYPNKDIYLLDSTAFARDDSENNLYTFEIMPWDPGTIVNLLHGKRFMTLDAITSSESQESRLKDILENTHIVVDISGFNLSSQMAFKEYNLSPGMGATKTPVSLGQLLYMMRIMISKKYRAEHYILPQSIGPFDYDFVDKVLLFPLMCRYLKYPKVIYPREKQGKLALKKFTEDNVKVEKDLVLTNNGYNMINIFENEYELNYIPIPECSVGIIPNIKVIERGDKSIYKLYHDMIKILRDMGKKVYILRHSEEDLFICENFKELFPEDDGVILIPDNLNAVEIEYVIKQFDYIIGSRYHSIIHAYKNGVPAVVIGWSLKYDELLEYFDQAEFVFDIRIKVSPEEIIESISKMEQRYKIESIKINDKVLTMNKNPVFKEIKLSH